MPFECSYLVCMKQACLKWFLASCRRPIILWSTHSLNPAVFFFHSSIILLTVPAPLSAVILCSNLPITTSFWPFSRTKVAMIFLRCMVDMTFNLSKTVGRVELPIAVRGDQTCADAMRCARYYDDFAVSHFYPYLKPDLLWPTSMM